MRRVRTLVPASARGALLLEMIFAVTLFAVCMLVVTGALSQAGTSLERAQDRQRTFGMARSVMSLLEAGVRSPQNMTGYMRTEDILSVADDELEDETGSEPEWLVEVETEASPFDGLTVVRVRVSHVVGHEHATALSTAVLHQLVRLGELGEDAAGGADATLERILDAERRGERDRTPGGGSRGGEGGGLR